MRVSASISTADCNSGLLTQVLPKSFTAQGGTRSVGWYDPHPVKDSCLYHQDVEATDPIVRHETLGDLWTDTSTSVPLSRGGCVQATCGGAIQPWPRPEYRWRDRVLSWPPRNPRVRHYCRSKPQEEGRGSEVGRAAERPGTYHLSRRSSPSQDGHLCRALRSSPGLPRALHNHSGSQRIRVE